MADFLEEVISVAELERRQEALQDMSAFYEDILDKVRLRVEKATQDFHIRRGHFMYERDPKSFKDCTLTDCLAFKTILAEDK